jgi:penicillin-binding protein 1A
MGYDQPRSMGGYAQGGRIAAPIFKEWAQTALKDQPRVPFVAPNGIRWVRVDRATGKRVFGQFPIKEDPKTSVIWEAFQPQTEPRRSYRRSQGEGAEQQDSLQDPQAQGQRGPPRIAVRRPRPAQPAATQPNNLPTQNAL